MTGRRIGGVTGVAILLLLVAVAAPVASGSDNAADQVIEVRFTGAAEIRGSGAALRARSAGDLDRVESLLAAIPASAVEPLAHGLSQTEATDLAIDARRKSGEASTNMANWYRVTVPAGATSQALETLRASPLVVHAARAPQPAAPPVTPNFFSVQHYLNPAPAGIDSHFALADPATRGSGVTVVDLEYAWTRTHEDLQLPPSTDMGEGQYIQYTAFGDEHGTAVFGIMAARDNGFGVTGAVPDITLKGLSPTMSPAHAYNPAGALTFLASRLTAGDVVLIEQQLNGPGPGTTDYVPLEWNQASFDAIKQLSNMGVVVVETGANGGYDLDSPEMLGRFDRSVRDSDAILVGAGDSVTHAPLWFTSHGSRIDLQGYGNNIVTTGGNGNLQGAGPGQEDIRYTNGFGGTSGAGPIVTSAVVSILSYLKAKGRPPMTADQLVSLLRLTGTPQASPGTGLIGPLPDIRKALTGIPVRPPEIAFNIPEDESILEFNASVNADFTCSDPDSDLLSCVATDLGPNGEFAIASGEKLPTDLPGPHTLTVTATDHSGMVTTASRLYLVEEGCFANGIFLASVTPRNRKVHLLGSADPVFAGSSAAVVRNNVVVASALVAENGSITATAPAPRSRKARARASYRLIVNGSSTSGMKARGGVKVISNRDEPGAVLIKARLTGIHRKGELTLRSLPVCGESALSQKVRHNRRGVFSVRLGYLPAAQIFTIRKGRKLIRLPLVLPADRFTR